MVVIPGYDRTVTGMRPAPLYGVDAQGNPVFTPYYSDPFYLRHMLRREAR